MTGTCFFRPRSSSRKQQDAAFVGLENLKQVRAMLSQNTATAEFNMQKWKSFQIMLFYHKIKL